jgi:glycosyltransferase involved in cell wall biosynthesis
MQTVNSTPLVTVLMSAYNTDQYVAESIESVLAQSFTDFEFLIIDDGSTDNTLSVIRSFNDPRIRVISRPNKGLIDSLNEGLVEARASLIARADADDVFLPGKLQEQYDFMNTHPDYILVASDVNYMDKDGEFLMRLNPAGHSYEEIKANFFKKSPFLHPTVMFRKEAVLAVGGYPKNALTFEDYLLWAKLLDKGKMCSLNKVYLDVRLNPDSVTIDEKWRGPEFIEIRTRSLKNGFVSDEDAKRLKEIISGQNFGAYKKGSYYALVGKKYLWDNPQPKKARENLAKAIKYYPKNKEAYALWLLSFLPSSWVQKIYQRKKGGEGQ